MNEIEQSAEKYFDELPPNFQKAINETPWQSLVNKIGVANSLDAVQLTSLETETMLILYGIEDAEDYISNLVRELGIDESKAQIIAGDIAKEVFEVISNNTGKELEKPTSTGPALITQETKKAVIEELSQRVERARQGSTTPLSKVIEKAPEIHPMIEEGEKVHDVPHVEPTTYNQRPTTKEPQPTTYNQQPTTNQEPKKVGGKTEPKLDSIPSSSSGQASSPQAKTEVKKPEAMPTSTRYPGGIDPYREPLQ